MTEEPNKDDNQQPDEQKESSPEKLQIDDQSNFPFHAAYLVYSDIFDNTTSDDVKREMNGYIEALKQNQIDLETYYRNVAHYRRVDANPHQERFSLQTQRKKDWRIREQREERIRRHKK
ncbi:MAG: hypothetical protein ACM3WQ_01375 [Chloroflexota bacterium]|nr:hypothetical protein [Candidatus Sulfotelmatobacter sp.]